MAGVPSGGMILGWLELYGLHSDATSFLTLRPGEWIRVRGDIVVRHWFATEQRVTADVEFQLATYRLPTTGPDHAKTAEPCIKQVAGRHIIAHMSPDLLP